MISENKVRGSVKILFHLVQISVILAGVIISTIGFTLLLKKDSLIPFPPKYVIPVFALCALSIANGYIGFNCINSERSTKIFIFILTLAALLNIQIILAIKSNNITDHSAEWINARWNALSVTQQKFIQNHFSCCGLETINDRVAGTCKFDTPCEVPLRKVLKGIKLIIQSGLIYMFFAETVSLVSFGFIKFIK